MMPIMQRIKLPPDTAAAMLSAFGVLCPPVIVSFTIGEDLAVINTRNHGSATIPQKWERWEIDLKARQVRLAAQRSAENPADAIASFEMVGGWISAASTPAQSFLFTLSQSAQARKNTKIRELASSLLTPRDK